jgi:hypothetical protein
MRTSFQMAEATSGQVSGLRGQAQRVTDEAFALRTAVSQAEISWNAYREAWERSGF